jgi:2-dehydro-3-deoxyphosphogluconate aldolase/(4S)-4-hydroxy-2-oxoglutarate aldolase
MTRGEACRLIEDAGIVVVVRAPSPEIAIRAVDALLTGGLSIFEITLTVPNARSVIQSLAARFKDAAVVGAGTVLSADEVRMSVDAGAQFIVSPGLDLTTIDAAHALDVAVVPGALTPTEVITATKADADMVKIFPCSAVGGAKYLKALKGPLPRVKLLPTGGISVSNAHEFIAAGAAAIGIGSELVDVAALKEDRDTELSARARELLNAVAAARSVRLTKRSADL